MSMKQPLPFSPGATLDVAWPWTDWLAGDTISSYTVTPSAGVTLDSDSRSGDDITAWISVADDSAPGLRLSVACTITTTGGRTDTRTVQLEVATR